MSEVNYINPLIKTDYKNFDEWLVDHDEKIREEVLEEVNNTIKELKEQNQALWKAKEESDKFTKFCEERELENTHKCSRFNDSIFSINEDIKQYNNFCKRNKNATFADFCYEKGKADERKRIIKVLEELRDDLSNYTDDDIFLGEWEGYKTAIEIVNGE